MVDKTGFPEGEQKHRFDVGKVTKTSLASEAKAAQQLNKKTINRFITKSGGLLNIAKQTPSTWQVRAILAALGAAYFIGSKIKGWRDKRTGETGKIPTQLQGKKTPKQLKGKHTGKYDKKQTTKKQTRSPTTLAKAKAAESIRLERKKIDEEGKKYARGGGVRKAARY